MKRWISIILTIVMIMGIFPVITFADTDFRIRVNDNIEGHATNEKLEVHGNPSFCGFGTGMKKTVITDTFSHSGSKSIMQTGRYTNGGTIKIHNLFGRTLSEKDVGKKFELSFYVYIDKNSGVYKTGADKVSESERNTYLYTEEELKDSVTSKFYVYMAGPDGNTYKYRTGTVGQKKYDVPWNEWTKITYEYVVKKDYLPTNSTEAKSDPYLDSVRVLQSGIDIIDKVSCDTFYIDDVEVKEYGVMSYVAGKMDDIESRETSEKLEVHAHPDYCGFGQGVGKTVITDTFAHSGSKSIMQTKRTSDGSIKVHNLFGRELTSDDVGRTFLLTFYAYADKNSGVYKKTVTGMKEDEKQAVRYSDEELDEIDGCEFYVSMAGPDAQNYQYRTGNVDIEKFFVPWNEWTQIHYYYTVEEKYLPTGSTEKLSDPYLESVRIGQNKKEYYEDEMICDTIYIDDIYVNEVGATINNNYYEDEVFMHSAINENVKADVLSYIVTEYDEGRLVSANFQKKSYNDFANLS